MRKRFLCIICCSMLAFSGCGVGSSVVNSGNYESKNQSNTIEKFKGLWISDLGENDIFINKEEKCHEVLLIQEILILREML